MADVMIDIQHLTLSFGENIVLDDISFQCRTGTITALLGPNGAGKTTLVRILSTLLLPDSGTALVNSHDVVIEPTLVRQSISLTGQFIAVDELLTGHENMQIAARLWRVPRSSMPHDIDRLFAALALTDAADRKVKEWSGGMRRKLDLAMSLLGSPKVLFLDEPTTGLDPKSRQALWSIVRELASNGMTILLTTQYLEEADRLADSVLMLHNGKIVASGSPVSLKSRLTGATLMLTFNDAQALLTADTALGEQTSFRHNVGQFSISVSTDGSIYHVNEVLDLLMRASVVVETVTLAPPTLDDVFFDMLEASSTNQMEIA